MKSIEDLCRQPVNNHAKVTAQDISCLYAAKALSQYITLKQPELPKGIAAITKLQEILEAKCKEAAQKIVPLGDLEDNYPEECYEGLNKIISETYEGILSEVRSTYENLKNSKATTEDDKKGFEYFLNAFKIADVSELIHDYISEENDQSETDRSMDEFGKECYDALANHLSSGGINTPEGEVAFHLANIGGLMFDEAVSLIDPEGALQKRVDRDTIKVNRTDLESYIVSAVNNGVYSAQGSFFIENPEKLQADAVKWLSEEINGRLDLGLEFNLLDSVSVRIGDDGLIYLKWDKREPYAIQE